MEPWFVLHRASDSQLDLSRALASQADFLELDIWAENGRLALRHDPLYSARLSAITRRHRAVPWPRGQRFWLDQAIDSGLPPGRTFLDIKHRDPSAIDLLVQSFTAADEGRGIVASTPHWSQLDRLCERLPATTLLYSIGKGRRGARAWTAYRERIRTGCAGGGVSIHTETATAERLAQLREQGLRAVCYTVNDWRRGLDLLQAGASGLTSDRSDLIAGWRDQSGNLG